MTSMFSAFLLGLASGAADLSTDGPFGFPQGAATVLCDTADLRFSVACDGTYLFAQAILWKDGDGRLGSTDDGRKIGDWSELLIDADADGKATPNVDREYSLDPWPSLPGLHYSVVYDEHANGGITGDSRGRGSIQYVAHGAEGAKVRVDTYLIPLQELGRKPGQDVHLVFWASSPEPSLVVNSVGYVPPEGKTYWSYHLPRDRHHSFTLASKSAAFDIQLVPEGRDTIAVQARAEPPRIGASVGEPGGPPEVSAGAWLNWSGAAPPALAALHGKVVVVEFWATWCGPCVQGIPHLNDLHNEFAKDGLVILSLTEQERGPVADFVARKGATMAYAVGAESESAAAYGVTGIPRAFVVGRDGKLLWAGHPQEERFDTAVLEALKAR